MPTTKADPDTDTVRRPFSIWLEEQAKGRTNAELTDALRDLVARVRDTGKKGTITLAVTIEPMRNDDDDTLVVTDKITLKLPEHDRQASLFFADKDNNLIRDNPAQYALDVSTGEITQVRT